MYTFVILIIAVKSTCPKGWQLFRGYCYKAVFKQSTWHQARSHCQRLKHDSDLVSIHSKAENDFVFSVLGPKAVKWKMGWIGYIYWFNEKKWKWVDGHTYATMPYWNWNAGEPNFGGYKPNCVHMRYQGKWNDNQCTTKMPFMCKVGLNLFSLTYAFILSPLLIMLLTVPDKKMSLVRPLGCIFCIRN